MRGVAGGIIPADEDRRHALEIRCSARYDGNPRVPSGSTLALRVVGVDLPHAAREAQRRVQQQGRCESVRVVDRKQMGGGPVRAALTGIGEVLEAVKGVPVAPLVRILNAEQILFAEAVVDLDVELVSWSCGLAPIRSSSRKCRRTPAMFGSGK